MKLFIKFFLSCLAFIFFTTMSFAVMPPEIYKKRMQESEIKAIAVVNKVEITGKDKMTVDKKVYFRLEKNFGDKPVSGEFTGLCESARTEAPLAGGAVYFYPEKNERVFVTVTGDGGYITGYTSLTPELEYNINNNFDKMKFGINEIYFD